MASKATPIQFLRSEVLNKRPDPAKLLPGQPAVNTNPLQPGLFFADNSGGSGELFKVGPAAIGVNPPNAGASGAPGQLGNTLGELWLDTGTVGEAILRVWDGQSWVNCAPVSGGGGGGATVIIDDVAPSPASNPDGSLWWNSSSGLMYILYNDGNSRQWTQIAGNSVQ